ncbi:MAG: hypothetical protein LDL30_07870 [Desulfovibrio sp.]|nr:hypothetical protein [Desulfovibrio sp.]MCA1985375.1 hypothetical protein [Desulfovibrio sp.]
MTGATLAMAAGLTSGQAQDYLAEYAEFFPKAASPQDTAYTSDCATRLRSIHELLQGGLTADQVRQQLSHLAAAQAVVPHPALLASLAAVLTPAVESGVRAAIAPVLERLSLQLERLADRLGAPEILGAELAAPEPVEPVAPVEPVGEPEKPLESLEPDDLTETGEFIFDDAPEAAEPVAPAAVLDVEASTEDLLLEEAVLQEQECEAPAEAQDLPATADSIGDTSGEDADLVRLDALEELDIPDDAPDATPLEDETYVVVEEVLAPDESPAEPLPDHSEELPRDQMQATTVFDGEISELFPDLEDIEDLEELSGLDELPELDELTEFPEHSEPLDSSEQQEADALHPAEGMGMDLASDADVPGPEIALEQTQDAPFFAAEAVPEEAEAAEQDSSVATLEDLLHVADAEVESDADAEGEAADTTTGLAGAPEHWSLEEAAPALPQEAPAAVPAAETPMPGAGQVAAEELLEAPAEEEPWEFITTESLADEAGQASGGGTGTEEGIELAETAGAETAEPAWNFELPELDASNTAMPWSFDLPPLDDTLGSARDEADTAGGGAGRAASTGTPGDAAGQTAPNLEDLADLAGADISPEETAKDMPDTLGGPGALDSLIPPPAEVLVAAAPLAGVLDEAASPPAGTASASGASGAAQVEPAPAEQSLIVLDGAEEPEAERTVIEFNEYNEPLSPPRTPKETRRVIWYMHKRGCTATQIADYLSLERVPSFSGRASWDMRDVDTVIKKIAARLQIRKQQLQQQQASGALNELIG